MRTGLCVIAISCMAAFSPDANALQTREDPTPSEIRTQGTATRSISPDLATVTFEFSAVSTTPREAGSIVALKADSLRRALGKVGIPRDSLVTGSRWYWWRPRVEMILGPIRYVRPPSGNGDALAEQDTTYRSWEVITARIHDFSKIGEAIDTALALGIMQISNVTFSRVEQDSIHDVALQAATARARRQAELIAEASGGRLGRVIWIGTEAPERNMYMEPYAVFTNASSGEFNPRGGQTVLVEPQLLVKVTVYGRWELVSN